jgi:hypothetical protein
MLSHWSRNFFFGVDQWDYSSRPGPWRYQYWNLDTDSRGEWSAAGFFKGMSIALGLAMFSSRLGLAWGKAMARIQR